MDHPLLQVGSKIRIISKANVRYEGTFVQIDTEKLQIALCDVQFFGTETRAADYFIAGQTRVYPFVVFKSTDVKDIRVIDKPKPTSPSEEYALEVSRMTSFSSLSGVSSINGSFASAGRSRRSLFDNNVQHVPFADQSYGYSQGHNNRCASRATQYMWRIPRVVDYIGRSGDPKDLPLKSNGIMPFAQDYDFEKYNKLFVDLCGGVTDLSLSSSESTANIDDESQELDSNESFIDNHALEPNSNNEQSSIKSEEHVSLVEEGPPSKGATPKKIKVYQSPKKTSISTAYDKNKSFFDAVSCNSFFRSPNTNPNWRERNTETFGVPMVCHQRRVRRNISNSTKIPKVTTFKQKPQLVDVSVAQDANSKRNNKSNNIKENVPHQFTIEKVHFKAVFLTQTSTPNKQEKLFKHTQDKTDVNAENIELKN